MASYVTVKLDTAKLDQLIKELPNRTDAVLGNVAHANASDMQDNMSLTSPAPAGNPPGVVSGELEESIEARHDGQGQWSVWGQGIGLLQEYGTIKMPARPFIMPSVDRIQDQLPELVKDIVSV